MYDNLPVVKLGLVATSRDCFPIQLSAKRKAAIGLHEGRRRNRRHPHHY